MAIPVTKLHILRVLLQVDTNLSQLQRDMRNNAIAWKAMAQSQSVPLATLQGYMNDAAAAYSARLSWMTTLQADTANWNSLVAMWQLLGGTSSEFTSVVSPLQAVATQLPMVDKSTYAACISVCDQITAAINAPLSLWPE
jgi:hypothetical protein